MSSTRSLAPAVALARLALGCGAALASVGAPAAGAEDPAGSPALMDSSPKVVQMTPYLVQVSVLGSIGVTFTLQGDDTEDVMAPIFWASITDVPPGGPGDRAGLKAGDELFASVMLALLERHETGSGKEIHVSMLQAAASWLITVLPLIDFGCEPSEITRAGNEHRRST